MALRWGIIGAGRISHDFVTAIQIFPNDHTVEAVGSRSLTTADDFAREHNIPKAYEGYLGLAKDEDIDVIYVGNLNTQHFAVTKLMLEHGKPVLCEKPFTMNEKQTTALVDLARSKKLFLMEAVWSRCFPAYQKLQELIQDGAIGEVKYANVNFGFPIQHVERLSQKELGGGAILDLGVYILQFQQFVFRGLKPIKIVASGHLTSEGVDESASAIITYPGGKTASVNTSSCIKMPNEGIVVGTKGTMKLPTFWCPTQLVTDEETFEFDLPKSSVPFLHFNSAGLYYQAEQVKKCLAAGKIECEHMTHNESIELARLMDILRKEVGVVFPEDSQ